MQGDLQGRTVIVTGASSGIGAAAAAGFAERGATVAVVGRSPARTAAVAERIGGRPHPVDYARLDDVRRLAAELLAGYQRIDVLANNAGAIFTSRRASADGHELTFQVNHLAPFLLTNLLLPRLAEAPDGARVINTASDQYRSGRLDPTDLAGADLNGARGRYRSLRAYARSKLANVLFTRELARRAAGTGVVSAAFHPGVVATQVARDQPVARVAMRLRLVTAFLTTPEQGAEPLLHLATVPDPESINGGYYHRLTRREPVTDAARDPDLAAALWVRSAELTGLPAQPFGP